MLLRKVFLASAAASLGVAAPVAACDLHGPGQMAGFHRYNPFANAFEGIQSRAQEIAKTEATAKRDDDAKRKADEKKRQKALEADAKDEVDAAAEKARKADLRERSQQGRGALK